MNTAPCGQWKSRTTRSVSMSRSCLALNQRKKVPVYWGALVSGRRCERWKDRPFPFIEREPGRVMSEQCDSDLEHGPRCHRAHWWTLKLAPGTEARPRVSGSPRNPELLGVTNGRSMDSAGLRVLCAVWRAVPSALLHPRRVIVAWADNVWW